MALFTLALPLITSKALPIIFGVDSLLISSGIHKSSFEKISPKWNTNKNQFKNLDIKPTYLCSKFKL